MSRTYSEAAERYDYDLTARQVATLAENGVTVEEFEHRLEIVHNRLGPGPDFILTLPELQSILVPRRPWWAFWRKRWFQ